MPKQAKKEIPNRFKSEIEHSENNKVKFTVHVSPEFFREGLNYVYNKNRRYFSIPGFRKGKAPRKIVEQIYGQDIFHEEAINYVLPDAYEYALDTHDLDPVYKPEIDATSTCEKEGAVFSFEIDTRPEVEVGEYIGIPYPKENSDVTESDIQAALRTEQEKNARRVSVDRKAELGDVVTINFTGYIDDEPFEGGSGQDFDLHLGIGQFIPGFEDQLVGFGVGDDVTVNVTFPENYSHEKLAGKPAVFEVEILDVHQRELPELDDEFAETVSEFETIEEYREDLRVKIKEYKEANLEGTKRNFVLKRLIEASTMEVPESMYLARLDEMMDDFSMQVRMRGMDVDNYMRFSDLTEEGLKATWRNKAEIDVKSALALHEVAVKENFTVDDEEVQAKLGEVMSLEGAKLEKYVSEMTKRQRKELERSILCKKALDLVLEKAIATEGLDDDTEIDIEDILNDDKHLLEE